MRRAIPVVVALLLVAALAIVLWPSDDDGSPAPAPPRPDAPLDPVPPPPASTDPTAGSAFVPPTVAPVQVDRGSEAPITPPDEVSVTTGRVEDVDGSPIGGATIRSAAPDGTGGARLAVTNAAGSFRLSGPPGLLLVEAEGFASHLVVPEGSELIVVLERAQQLEGLVVSEESGLAIEGARVEGLRETWRQTALTDAAGRFELTAPQGEVLLLVSAPRHVARTATSRDLPRIALARGVGVEGRLVLPDGRAPTDARVWIIGADQLTTPHRASVTQGRFRIEAGLSPAEAFAVLAFTDRHATPWDLMWRERAEGEIVVELLERGSVVLTGFDGQRLPVLVPPLDLGDASGKRERTGSTIRYLQRAAGSYSLELAGAPLADVRVPVGGVVSVVWSELATSAAGNEALLVRVTDRQGVPLSGATVVVSAMRGELEAVSDGRGEAPMAVTAGTLTIRARAPGRVLLQPAIRDEGDRRDVTLVLVKATVLAGQVFPNERAELRLLDASDHEVREAWSDDQGRFRMEQLPAGEFVLEVVTEHKVPLRVSIRLPLSGGELHVHLTEDYPDCGHPH